MHPEWRLIPHLRHQSRADDDEAGQEHDEDGRPVAGIGEAIIEPANVAARPQRDKSLEQFTLAAARTGAGQAGEGGTGKRVDRFVHNGDVVVRSSPRKRGPQFLRSARTGFPLPPSRYALRRTRTRRSSKASVGGRRNGRKSPPLYSGTGTPEPHT